MQLHEGSCILKGRRKKNRCSGGGFSQMWVGCVADFQTPQNLPKSPWKSPFPTWISPFVVPNLTKPWGGWVNTFGRDLKKREGFRKKFRKSMIFCQTSLGPPLFWSFLRKWTIDEWNKFYTWSHPKIFIFASVSVYIWPKSDISGALGPIHYITLKAFAMALGDGTKCKICFGGPRMILHAHWKNAFPK